MKTALDKKKIRDEGMELIEEFSKMLKDVPETEETHYVIDLRNVSRADGEPKKRSGFQEKMKKLSTNWEEGYVVAEKGR